MRRPFQIKPPVEDDAGFDLSSSADDRERAKVIRITAAMADTPRNVFAAIIGGFVIAALGDYSTPSAIGSMLCWVWWSVLTIECIRVIWLSRRFNRCRRTQEETFSLSRRLAPSGMFCGFVFGSCAWIMLPIADPRAESVFIIFNTLVMMGAVGAKALYRPTALQFVIPQALSFVSGLMRLGDGYHLMLGCAFAALTYVLLMASRIQDDTMNTAIYLRFKTERLLLERTTQQLETDAARRDALRAKDSAELADRDKTTFLTAAGHDLRQPMHALVLYFGQLERLNRDAALDEIVGRIGRSLESMQELLDSILEVSKLMMGSVKPVWTRFGLAPALDRLDAQMRPIAAAKHLSFEVRGSEAVVRSDEVLLERILRNLVLNAIRYTDRGHVVVRTKLRNDSVVIQVFDSGAGISRSQRELVFQAFYQASNRARDRRKGLGIGLTIVRNLCQLLDIGLVLRSRVGKGTLFELNLPMSNDAAGDVSAPGPRRVRDFTRGAVVVLIDDNDDSLDATESSLRSFGCQVVSARSGASAVEALRMAECMPQLILSDYRLETETGLEAIRTVIDNQQGLYGTELGMAALLISGDTAPAEMKRVQEAGYPMLHKPLTLEALYDAVNSSLESLATASALPPF